MKIDKITKRKLEDLAWDEVKEQTFKFIKNISRSAGIIRYDSPRSGNIKEMIRIIREARMRGDVVGDTLNIIIYFLRIASDDYIFYINREDLMD